MKFRSEDNTQKQSRQSEEIKHDTSEGIFSNEKNETVYIDMDQLRPNKRNEYKMTDIENLSAMIKLAGGILQNLIVSPADEEGYYTITTGERRWRAAQLLKDKGEYPEHLNNTVPCTIKNPSTIDLPLDENAKEDFSILVTNQYRNKTDGELYMEMKKWKDIIGQLRSAGVEYLPVGYNDGNEPLQIKGTKTRELIASQLGVSDRQVTRLEGVEKHGSNKLLDMLMTDQLNLSAAESMIHLPASEQDEILEEIKEEVPSDVRKAVKKKVREKEHRQLLEQDEIVSDMNAVIEIAESGKVLLSEANYKKYRKIVGQLKQLLIGERNEN